MENQNCGGRVWNLLVPDVLGSIGAAGSEGSMVHQCGWFQSSYSISLRLQPIDSMTPDVL